MTSRLATEILHFRLKSAESVAQMIQLRNVRNILRAVNELSEGKSATVSANATNLDPSWLTVMRERGYHVTYMQQSLLISIAKRTK